MTLKKREFTLESGSVDTYESAPLSASLSAPLSAPLSASLSVVLSATLNDVTWEFFIVLFGYVGTTIYYSSTCLMRPPS